MSETAEDSPEASLIFAEIVLSSFVELHPVASVVMSKAGPSPSFAMSSSVGYTSHELQFVPPLQEKATCVGAAPDSAMVITGVESFV